MKRNPGPARLRFCSCFCDPVLQALCSYALCHLSLGSSGGLCYCLLPRYLEVNSNPPGPICTPRLDPHRPVWKALWHHFELPP